ncbi:MAG: FtsH Extracellular, partial [Actinomycetota bacterium]
MTPDNQLPPPPPSENRGNGRSGNEQGWPRWTIAVIIAVVIGVFAVVQIATSTPSKSISYGDFITDLQGNNVKEATFDNANGKISGTLNDGTNFSTTGPIRPSDADQQLM